LLPQQGFEAIPMNHDQQLHAQDGSGTVIEGIGGA
jgi:hypothetical protein